LAAQRVIKSSSNVGGLPKKMNLKLVEPLKHLFKESTVWEKNLAWRMIVVWRQPFPGPGWLIALSAK